MKKIYKKIFLSLCILLSGMFMAGNAMGVSQNSNAGENGNKPEERVDRAMRSEIKENMCNNLTNRLQNLEKRTADLANQIRTRKETQFRNWEGGKAERDANLAALRTRRDGNIEEHFKKLEEKATDKNQEEAVATFKKAMQNAIEARRIAIDAAITNFRKEADIAIQNHKGTLSESMDAFQSAQKAAFEKAIANCGDSTTDQSLKATLKSELDSAREKLKANRQESETLRVAMQELTQKRMMATDQAISDFRSAVEAAKEDLVKAFPED